LLVLSANAPDIDVLGLIGGPLKYFETHRGYTHSLVGLPFMALLTVIVVAVVFRQRLPWGKAWLLCVLGVASHLLIDWTNDYGLRVLLPFSSRWFALDINSLYDGAIWAALIFAALWPLLERLVNGEIGMRGPAGRGVAVFALTFFLLYDCGRAMMHGRAIAQLQSVLYDGTVPVRTSTLPNPFNPFRWKGVVETERSFQVLPVDVFGSLESRTALIFYKARITQGLQLAAQTEPFRYFLYFARFPVWSEDRDSVAGAPVTRVELMDLRFGLPGSSAFRCTAIEDPQGRVLESKFTP
jgi:inner membrane protein